MKWEETDKISIRELCDKIGVGAKNRKRGLERAIKGAQDYYAKQGIVAVPCREDPEHISFVFMERDDLEELLVAAEKRWGHPGKGSRSKSNP
jgi:hypothetical protein